MKKRKMSACTKRQLQSSPENVQFALEMPKNRERPAVNEELGCSNVDPVAVAWQYLASCALQKTPIS